MIFWYCVLAHWVADFPLQLWSGLDKFKQRSWWVNICREKGKELEATRYEYDYIAAMTIHAVGWSAITFLPLVLAGLVGSKAYTGIVLINAAVHFIVDHVKANWNGINLCEDQFCHLLQISATLAVVWAWR